MRFLFMVLLLFLIVARCPGMPGLYILGDLDKPTGDQNLINSPSLVHDGTIHLDSAGNEVVAFQAILQADRREDQLRVELSDLKGPAMLRVNHEIHAFLAHYIQAIDAGYSWGPGSKGVLPWRHRKWPDVLVPFSDPYSENMREIIRMIRIDPRRHRNQSVWFDVFIPRDSPPGRYIGNLHVYQRDQIIHNLPVVLQVHGFNLPDTTSTDAWTQIYRESGIMFDTGIKFRDHPDAFWEIYKRYIQLAHAHRIVATMRAGEGPSPARPDGQPANRSHHPWQGGWQLYSPWVDTILKGSLFEQEAGYYGPCMGKGPSFYPAPFIESFYGFTSLQDHLARHDRDISLELRNIWKANASDFYQEIKRRDWEDIRFLAYIFDEVDSPRDTGEEEAFTVDPEQIIDTYRAAVQVQEALDEGTGGKRIIQLMWTTHADLEARGLVGGIELRNSLSWFAPNAHALNLGFYDGKTRHPAGKLWFYHSGHPATGNHTINQLGIDMCLWGLLCRRYPVDGAFMWSGMFFAEDYRSAGFNPYDHPVYKYGETRWGNGVLFYPGSRLKMIGTLDNIKGPVPGMRMKAWRSGLQLVEYCRLADTAGAEDEVNRLLKDLIPSAFSEADLMTGRASWRKNPNEYYRLKEALISLIEGSS
jgi:hypothetical protein